MHLNEELLQETALKNENFSEKDSMHLAHCAYCRERYAGYLEYYASLDDKLDEPFTDETADLSSRLLPQPKTKLLPQRDVQIIPRGSKFEIISANKYALALRDFFYQYPKTVLSGATLIAAALVFTFMTVARAPKPANIIYAKAENGFLIAYNQTGEKAWAKFIADGFDAAFIQKTSGPGSVLSYLLVDDINADNRNEIVLIKWGNAPRNERKNITCYDADGNVLWTCGFNKKLVTKTEEFSDEYYPHRICNADLDSDGVPELYAIFGHAEYFPRFITRINTVTGTISDSYFHPGYLVNLEIYNPKGTETPLLLAYGTSNSFQRAVLLALSYDQISGYAPSDSTRTPVGMNPASETKYLLFPKCYPFDLSSSLREGVSAINIREDGSILVAVAHNFENFDANFQFELNNRFDCVQVSGGDHLYLALNDLKKAGKPVHIIDSLYFNNLRNSIQYFRK